MESDLCYRVEARYGALEHRAEFRSRFEGLRRGQRCILRTERGVEAGVLTGEPAPFAEEGEGEQGGEVLRVMDADDEARVRRLEERARSDDFRFCLSRIRERDLPMRLVHVEHLFGGGKILFYFVADGRVDFRELVKDLARHFRTRIELRQIGVRDEAKILGDQEYCGRDLCCGTWMREILPVTMRMAKNQKSTLDPNKISGRCGRLKCCLRFEDEIYAEIRRRMPRVGRRVVTERGEGKVLSVDTLARTVNVELASGERIGLPVDGVRPFVPPPEKPDACGDEEE